MTSTIAGWDIGGAHVKLAVLERDSRVKAVYQRPCPLWRDLERLREVMRDLLRYTDHPACLHALTMTGELADLFESRADGVARLLGVLSEFLPRDAWFVYAGQHGLKKYAEIQPADYPWIASANWLASAMYAACHVSNGVFIDVGSTSTDLIPIANGGPVAAGFSDYERLCSRELVYSGVVRTPVCALVREIRFAGRTVPMVAEHFAVTADVYRLTGELPAEADQWPACDHGTRDARGSARRLARMLGCDLGDASMNAWRGLAEAIKRQQTDQIVNALKLQLRRIESVKPCLIGAGCGRFLVEGLSRRLRLDYIDFSSLLVGAGDGPGSADCAPAVSVAKLLYAQMRAAGDGEYGPT